jgi:hypothetical protein
MYREVGGILVLPVIDEAIVIRIYLIAGGGILGFETSLGICIVMFEEIITRVATIVGDDVGNFLPFNRKIFCFI